MIFHPYPAWSVCIRNHYWYLRAARGFNSARRRKEYRRIAVEKKRLVLSGVDSEAVRLLCRHLVNPRFQLAEQRFWARYFETLKKPSQPV